MHKRVPQIAAVLVALAPILGRAEDTLPELLSQPGADLSDPAFRANVVARLTATDTRRRNAARAKAQAMGLALKVNRPNGRIEELAGFRDDGRPLYFTTQNANAAISTGANLLRTAPYTLSGDGIVIGEWDGGAVRSTHQEFGTRITIVDNVGNADHATHVAGTMIASGVNASARGMAASATIRSYDWNNDIAEMTAVGASVPAQAGKIYLSNHSYGFISGWNYVNGGSPYRLWEWNGNGTTSLGTEQDFGRYNTYTRDVDSLAFSTPYYLVFQSAGNERSDNPAAGDSVSVGGSVVNYDAAIHPPGDGAYRGGFDSMSYNSLAKNVLTVGSVADAVTGGLRDVSKAAMSSYSSWGPTDDGRIKPDVVANGEYVYSSLAGSNTSYGYYSGTSMATPNACGSASLLIEQYGDLFPGQAMRSSTLKALLIHTADDLGNPGPDYKFGWGLINVKAAADVIADQAANAAKQRISENQLSTATISRSYSFLWDGVSPLTATLCWTDPAGTSTTTSDSRDARLVHNLNLKLIAPGGAEYLPYVMPFVGTWTQVSMDSAATTGVNNTDNVEQVRIAAPPAAGIYQAVVSYSGSLTSGPQYYSLILSGTSTPPPGIPSNLVATPGNNSVSLSWTAASNATSYKVKRSTTSGGPYITVGTPTATSYTDLTVPNGTTYYYVVSAVNSNGESANSAQASATPAAVASVTTLASSLGSSGNYGSSVTFTATVSGGIPTPMGSVSFYDGASLLGTGSLNVSGQATLATSALAIGGHSITASFGGDLIYGPSTSLAFSYAVSPKPVTITGVAAGNKVYDATTAATLSGGVVSGVVGGETVNVVSGTGTFDSPNAGTRNVIASGYAISGPNAGNYVLSAQPAPPAAVIAPRPLILSGVKTYDGTNNVSSASLVVSNNLDGANLALTGFADLIDRNVGMQSLSPDFQISRVQYAAGSTGTSNGAPSFSVTLGSAPISGNTMIAVISTRGSGSGIVTSITQSGATWTRAVQEFNTDGVTTEIWYAPGVSNAGTSININQGSVKSAAVVMEYSGLLEVGALDQTATAIGTGTTAVTGSTPVTSQGRELWIGAIGISGNTPTMGSILNGFSNIASANSTRFPQTGTNAKVFALEKIVSSAGTASSGGTLSNSVTWTGAVATFKSVVATSLLLSGSASGNYTAEGMTGSVSINPKPLVWGGLSPVDREYDGGQAVALTGSSALLAPETAGTGSALDGKPYTGDVISLTGSAEGSYANKHAGVSKPVSVAGVTLGGADAGNYTLFPLSGLTGKVLPKPLTVTAVEVSKTYDGSTSASGTPSLSQALQAGDTVGLLAQEFQDSSAGEGTKILVPSIVIHDGNGGANYAVTLVNCSTGTIHRAPATVALGNLLAAYNGSPVSAMASTTPAGLAVDFTYNGSPTPPTDAGSYAVVATVTDPNYLGSASGSLVISKASAVVSLGGLEQTHDGTPKPVTVITTPTGLASSVTYDGSAAPPSAIGSYQIIATITDPNYEGSATGTLVIAVSNNFSTWQEAHFTQVQQGSGQSDPNADPDADGLVNLAEYALGTDPLQFTPPLSAVKDVNGLTLTFSRPANLPDVTYKAEVSDGLGTWSEIPLEVIGSGDPETVRARDPLTSGNPNKRFIRLRFTRD